MNSEVIFCYHIDCQYAKVLQIIDTLNWKRFQIVDQSQGFWSKDANAKDKYSSKIVHFGGPKIVIHISIISKFNVHHCQARAQEHVTKFVKVSLCRKVVAIILIPLIVLVGPTNTEWASAPNF